MVIKMDSSWHMCTYYKHLNKMIIQVKFPIPIIDELLDELNGEKYFLSWILIFDIIKLDDPRRHSQNNL